MTNGGASRRSSIQEQNVTRGSECTRLHYENTSESPAFTKPIRMFDETISCQSTVLHVKGAGSLSEHPEPNCEAHVCTLAASNTVRVAKHCAPLRHFIGYLVIRI